MTTDGLTLPYLSHSTAGLFASCPTKFHLRKVAKVNPSPAMASVGGRAAHRLIQEWDEAGEPDWPDDQVKKIASDILSEMILAEEAESGVPISEWRVGGRASKAWPAKEDRKWWEAQLPAMLGRYRDWRATVPDWEIWRTPEGAPAIELEISVDVPGLDVPFLCFIDRIFRLPGGELIVWDAKFGSMPVDDLTQLARYAMAVDLKHGVRPAYGAIYAGRKGELDAVLKDGETLMPLAHLPSSVVAAGLAAEYRLMSVGVYPPRPGRHCSWCDVRRACAWTKGELAWRHDPNHPDYRPKYALGA